MRRGLLVLVLVVAGFWVLNSSVLVRDVAGHETRLIAHRGVHQVYAGADRSAQSCHASPVLRITHGFIENTLPSMAEAFRLGADVVELDVHLTPDPVFAVFHDWTLGCRTDGNGVTHEQAIAMLKTLDLGYGVDDGSRTYPLRGQGVGLMPTLAEVFAARMPGQFLINFKSKRAEEGVALAEMLEDAELRGQVFGVYGGAPPTEAAMAAVAGLRGYDFASVKACLIRYAALGWSGYVPRACRDRLVVVPLSHAGYLWGWPHRFTRRLARHGTDVILAGPYDGSGFTSGIDDAEMLARVPFAFDGYLWTNRVEVIGPAMAQR